MSANEREQLGLARAASRRQLHRVQGGMVGGLTGAGLGLLAGGPVGAIAGLAIGGAVGALTAWALDANAVEAAWHDQQLDADIGVTNGDLGSPNLEHPPAKIGAFSREVSGAGTAVDIREAHGPITPPPD
jgi:hypothetical protein